MTVTVDEDIVTHTEEEDDDEHRRCQIIIYFTLKHRSWSRTWTRKCSRQAHAVVRIICPLHRDSTQGICRPHLRLLKRDKGRHLRCADCDLPASWHLV